MVSRADSGIIFKFYYDFDDFCTTTIRTSYNTLDALAATGGFASVIMLIFKILTSRIQKVLYYLSMIRRLYIYQEGFSGDSSSKF